MLVVNCYEPIHFSTKASNGIPTRNRELYKAVTSTVSTWLALWMIYPPFTSHTFLPKMAFITSIHWSIPSHLLKAVTVFVGCNWIALHSWRTSVRSHIMFNTNFRDYNSYMKYYWVFISSDYILFFFSSVLCMFVWAAEKIDCWHQVFTNTCFSHRL